MIFFFSFFLFFLCLGDDKYKEELILRPINSHHICMYFSFTLETPYVKYSDNNDFSFTSLFPNKIKSIFIKNNLNYISHSISRGIWENEKYGVFFLKNEKNNFFLNKETPSIGAECVVVFPDINELDFILFYFFFFLFLIFFKELSKSIITKYSAIFFTFISLLSVCFFLFSFCLCWFK
jgi:hypothetical protein